MDEPQPLAGKSEIIQESWIDMVQEYAEQRLLSGIKPCNREPAYLF
jgi:hypothetical protein